MTEKYTVETYGFGKAYRLDTGEEIVGEEMAAIRRRWHRALTRAMAQTPLAPSPQSRQDAERSKSASPSEEKPA